MKELGVWRCHVGGGVLCVAEEFVEGEHVTYMNCNKDVFRGMKCVIEKHTESIDHYFLDSHKPTEKELLLLSIIEPKIHKQIVEIMKTTIDNNKVQC